MTDDIIRLERDLDQFEKITPKKSSQVIQQTAIRTKEHWSKAATGGGTARGRAAYDRYGAAIDYDLKTRIGEYTAEIGAHRGGVGSFGSFDDPNSAGVRIRPSRARRDAEKFAEQDLDRGIKKAVDESSREAGL